MHIARHISLLFQFQIKAPSSLARLRLFNILSVCLRRLNPRRLDCIFDLKLEILLIVVLFSFPALGAEQKGMPAIKAPPLGEQWFSVGMGGERNGFSRLQTIDNGNGYELAGEGSVKILVLGFSRESSTREKYQVNRDLTLKSFNVEQTLDGSWMKVSGEMTAKGIRTTIETTGLKKEKLLKAKGKVYPPPALNLIPLLTGSKAGQTIKVQMLDVEAVSLKNVEILVIGRETLADGREALHLRNNLYPMVDNDIWVDFSGNTIKESVRDGLVEIVAESGESAGKFIAEAAVAKKDLILDFSRIKIDPPIGKPAELKGIVLTLSGIPKEMVIPGGAGQTVTRQDNGLLTVAVSPGLDRGPEPLDEQERLRLLAPTLRILPDHGEIVGTKNAILGAEKEPQKIVKMLTGWVATTITDSMVDTQTPVETLSTKSGNCQTHARLYVSLARAAGVPTKFVSGLVYVEGKGFLYHSWAESYVGRWVAVDPTFGQVPADPTHVKLIEGDGIEDLAALAGVIGRLGAKVVEQRR